MLQDLPVRRRNVIVVGGSAGALAAVREMLGRLPADLSATVFFVQHMAADARTSLAKILDGSCKLTVRPAADGSPVRLGEVQTCRPDQHLLLVDGRVRLVRGPRENHSRPAIDPLFRSAAAEFQTRVVAVLLSGYLSDGVSGLNAVRRCGGLTMVQSPDDADVADLPMNALDHHQPDFVAPAGRLGDLIVELVAQPAPEPGPVPDDIAMEVRMSQGQDLSIRSEEELGERSPFACPECGGNLWEIKDVLPRYRCHVGHGFTGDALAELQEQTLDAALWSALRGLRERGRLLRKLETEARERGASMSERFDTAASEVEEQAEVLSRFILARQPAAARPEPGMTPEALRH